MWGFVFHLAVPATLVGNSPNPYPYKHETLRYASSAPNPYMAYTSDFLAIFVKSHAYFTYNYAKNEKILYVCAAMLQAQKDDGCTEQ